MVNKRKSSSGPPSGQKSIAAFFSAAAVKKPTSPEKDASKQDKEPKSPVRTQKRAPATPPTRQSPRVKNANGTAEASVARATPGSASKGKSAPLAQQHTPIGNGVAAAKTMTTAATNGKPPASAARASLTPSKRPKTPEQGAAAKKELVGCRLRVWWTDDAEWYSGEVARFDAAKGRHLIEYDDGEEEWVDLASEKYEVLKGQAAAKARPAGRQAQMLLSDSDEEVEAADAAELSGDDSESDFEAPAADDSDSDDEELVASEDEGSEPEEEAPAAKKRKTAAKAKANGRKTPQAVPNRGNVQPSPASVSEHQIKKPTATDPSQTAQLRTAQAQPGAKEAMSSAFGGSDGFRRASTGGDLAGPSASQMEQFAARSAERFPFLHPSKLKDASGIRPGQPGYNPRTLLIPPTWFKAQKVSPGQQQWWEFKAKNFDSVLLFKMGRFYEMFEMDAYVGVDVLGLSLMKGEQPHCGFPEPNYLTHCERLARAGLRVVVIEQTETPAQLAVRNEQRKKSKLPKVSVVNRDMVAVVTRGTMTDSEMLATHPDAAFVLALCERSAPATAPACASSSAPAGQGQCARTGDAQHAIGACAVDVATGHILVGQWSDGELRAGLRSHLAALQPVELILPADGLSEPTRHALKGVPGEPRMSELPTRDCWDAERTRRELEAAQYFGSDVPAVLQELLAETDSDAAVCALGAAVSFLRTALLDKAVLPTARLQRLPPAGAAACLRSGVSDDNGPEFMALDGAALQNLEVLENSNGGAAGSLLAATDHCVSGPSRRLLRRWLTCPLARPADIVRRQDAVAALLGPACEAAQQARNQLRGAADMERGLARLTAAAAGASARDGAAVVLYEDAARRRVAALAGALRSLRTLADIAAIFSEAVEECNSELLRDLVTPGRRFPDMDTELSALESATDWTEAQSNGRVVPRQGVDAAYDEAAAAIEEAEAALQQHLKEVRKAMGGGREICFVTVNKDTHLIEVPETLKKSVPGDFELAANRKGFLRYRNPEQLQLVAALNEAQQAREERMSATLQVMLGRFAEQHALWLAAVEAVAELDALMSLAVAAASGDGNMCRPEFVEAASEGPVFRAIALRHPCAFMTAAASNFVPNDVTLGGGQPPFILLTGPNMGGKSTLLRQVCLATVLAQIGAWVPAQKLQLSVTDAVFVRMGARDHIMAGESTFFVEMSETAAMLQAATGNSLVALDELGRGTATSDGAAVAAAVLQHLSSTIRCRGLFATHYHRLAEEHAVDPGVAIKHMECAVTPATPNGDPENVTFLYRLGEGACPKSYGMNVARLAGLPESVVTRAAQCAATFEASCEAAEGEKGGCAAALGNALTAALGHVHKALEAEDGAALLQLHARLRTMLDQQKADADCQ